jgi:hypothetical protein
LFVVLDYDFATNTASIIHPRIRLLQQSAPALPVVELGQDKTVEPLPSIKQYCTCSVDFEQDFDGCCHCEAFARYVNAYKEAFTPQDGTNYNVQTLTLDTDRSFFLEFVRAEDLEALDYPLSHPPIK